VNLTDKIRCAYHSLKILLLRPFVSDGHLLSISDTCAAEAFTICTTASFQIEKLLELYGKQFCFKTSPFLMSYATYVSGTIFVRLAAQSPSGSDAHKALRRCLDVLAQQKRYCHAPRKTLLILQGLITRLGVNVNLSTNAESQSFTNATANIEASNSTQGVNVESISGLETSQTHPSDSLFNIDGILTDFDITKILDTFTREEDHYDFPALLPPQEAESRNGSAGGFGAERGVHNGGYDVDSNQDWATFSDMLYGPGLL
jgi:hypothetical protein